MMNGSRALAALVVLLGVSAPAGTAYTAPRSQLSMTTGSVTSQPIGHYEFCRLHRDECSIKSKPAALPRLTPHGWDVVRGINQTVNSTIIPVTDAEAYGREEVWAYPVDAGDCEDFVLLKRKKLMEAGFSATDLLITVVRKPDGEGHAVLTLRSAQGDFILDNLNDQVELWTQTPYTYLKRQASFDTGRWVTIENGTTDVMVGALK
ncbi:MULTISPECIES: transglutaminase-like cysteine peptidase [Alphaproteobacteria]|uniref:Transglutaminase n=2 Tax=Alphaproteobacteria TaxID=28211 RepID=A0A512HE70_9HYPH|nr:MULTISPECIES: transglutaminase-like cysteine peptidase [Alphaproteobacteria]GEO83751.1 transglutaminase [Ciceribacter naphthalenivorans]GLR24097.1 transglutaminase [Ciceribacter naphthalenivorans]GLT06953.1 transglutaminase [Sphingomonas psychrolutea]